MCKKAMHWVANFNLSFKTWHTAWPIKQVKPAKNDTLYTEIKAILTEAHSVVFLYVWSCFILLLIALSPALLRPHPPLAPSPKGEGKWMQLRWRRVPLSGYLNSFFIHISSAMHLKTQPSCKAPSGKENTYISNWYRCQNQIASLVDGWLLQPAGLWPVD